MSPSNRQSQLGQAIPLFALALTAIILGVGLVIDGGYAYTQRRTAQNAADFAALAGTRIVGESLTGRPTGSGIAANVEKAVKSVLTANEAEFVNAQYVDETGAVLGNVEAANLIPPDAFGVVVEARTAWKPFMLGIMGVADWVATARATAMTSGASNGGGVMPLGIKEETWDSLKQCPPSNVTDCIDGLTPGELNIPGGFGWLKFGRGGQCGWSSSLGMDAGGCESSKTFLDYQIGPKSHPFGCCDPVGGPGVDRIGSLTGNEWGDLSWYSDGGVIVWVPIWDHAGGSGANGWYHIIGFGAIMFTGGNEHAKWLEGAALDVTQKCGIEQNDGTKLNYCSAPGGEFIIGATGEVQLRR